MAAVLIGYARPLDRQAGPRGQPAGPAGVRRVRRSHFLGRAYSGADRVRPHLEQALAPVRAGGTLGVPELDRRMLTRQGKAVAWAKGRFKGRQSMLSASRQAHLLELHAAGAHAVSELPELFEVSRLTVYRVWERAQAAPGGTAVWAC